MYIYIHIYIYISMCVCVYVLVCKLSSSVYIHTAFYSLDISIALRVMKDCQLHFLNPFFRLSLVVSRAAIIKPLFFANNTTTDILHYSSLLNNTISHKMSNFVRACATNHITTIYFKLNKGKYVTRAHNEYARA